MQGMAKTKLSQTVRRKAITCQLNRRFGPVNLSASSILAIAARSITS